MTDNEIKKALECCSDELHFCSVCPYYLQDSDNDLCQEDMNKNALDLIKYQEAVIEQYKTECSNCFNNTTQCIESLQNTITEKQAEIETLRVNVKASKRIIQRLKERILMSKSEAIKEFWEELKKEKYYGSNRMGYGTWVVELDDIDNLAKEKVGEN